MHRLPLAASVALVVALAACSSSTSGGAKSGSPTSGSSSPSSSAASSSTSNGGFPTTVTSLGALMLNGIGSMKSAHITLNESTSSTPVSGSGDELLSHGRVTAMNLSEKVGGLALQYIIIGTRVYAKLPAAIYQSPKPWVQLSSTVSNARLRQVYSSMQQSLQTSAGQSTGIFVKASKDLKLLGTEQFDGTQVGHYSMTVDVASLPSSQPGKSALQQAGITSIPLQVYIDTKGRPRKVTEHITVAGQTVDVLATLTKIDQPVHISPPPANQVAHP